MSVRLQSCMPLEIQALVRTLYGILLFLEFLIILPFSKIYFTTERYRGCIDSSRWRDIFFSPAAYYPTMGLWMLSAVMLALGKEPLLFSALNLLLCYQFFIRDRWKSIFRGMGAPGFISYWLAAFVFLVEYATAFGDPQGKLRDLVIFTFRFDFAIMMIDSGINKIGHGYFRLTGMNYGMANPAWGYWSNFFKRISPKHFIYFFLNFSAFIFQILGGICLLLPPVHWFGAVIIFGSFLLVKTVIRLGVLCDMLMLITFIYAHPNGLFHSLLTNFPVSVPQEVLGSHGTIGIVNGLLPIFLWAYIALLPLAKLGMYTNFYFKKTLPAPLQKTLEFFTNTFGVILWRVFTIDLIDFFIRVSFEDKQSGKRTPYTRFGHWRWNQINRFLWVGESIMSLIVFNTERYFVQPELFKKRVIRYAKTMPVPENHNVIFEYVFLIPRDEEFEYLPAKEYKVDPWKETIDQKVLSEEAVKTRVHSPIQTSVRPGSYAPSR